MLGKTAKTTQALLGLWLALSLAARAAPATALPPCLHGYVDLAARSSAGLESRRLHVHGLDANCVVEEFIAPTGDPAELHPRIVQGLLTANARFRATRPGIEPDYVFRKQERVDPTITHYFVLGRPGEKDHARGFGMMVDGTEGKAVPMEREFPDTDFRHREGQSLVLIEVARLGIAEGEKGGLHQLFRGMARSLLVRYGSPDKIPANLRIVLWTSQKPLMERYRDTYGFEEWESPQSHIGKPDAWAMGATARDFVARYP